MTGLLWNLLQRRRTTKPVSKKLRLKNTIEKKVHHLHELLSAAGLNEFGDPIKKGPQKQSAKQKKQSQPQATIQKPLENPSNKNTPKKGASQTPDKNVQSKSNTVAPKVTPKSTKKHSLTSITVPSNQTAKAGFSEIEMGQRAGLSDLQKKMFEKLQAAQFRQLNETLYTSKGEDALRMFSEDPSLFDIYHRGFRLQVEKWPKHPLDIIIQELRSGNVFGLGSALTSRRNDTAVVPNNSASTGKNNSNNMPGKGNGKGESGPVMLRVADFGCGEGRLGKEVPLPDACLDIAVFCLALMGTNYVEFLREAHRTLRPNGVLIIAEVKSRLDIDPKRFTRTLACLGFEQQFKDVSNTHFALYAHTKARPIDEERLQSVAMQLKPCVYKKR